MHFYTATKDNNKGVSRKMAMHVAYSLNKLEYFQVVYTALSVQNLLNKTACWSLKQ